MQTTNQSLLAKTSTATMIRIFWKFPLILLGRWNMKISHLMMMICKFDSKRNLFFFYCFNFTDYMFVCLPMDYYRESGEKLNLSFYFEEKKESFHHHWWLVIIRFSWLSKCFCFHNKNSLNWVDVSTWLFSTKKKFKF